MKIKTLILAFGLLVLPGLPDLYSQQVSIVEYLANCERKYGSDADLVNGEKYFYPYIQSQGDPFFLSEPRASEITIEGKEFSGQELRYDLFNQQLVLDYTDLYGATSSLILRNEWIESFSLEAYFFKKMRGPDGETGYFQVVFEGAVSCVYFWRKEYLLNLASGVREYYFTDPTKVSFLVIGEEFRSYRGNSSFLKLFDSEPQKAIKQFLRQSKIKVKKASDSQMHHLIEYCNSLSYENS
jgi:hypothetical protein